jgi:hypothetical protein
LNALDLAAPRSLTLQMLEWLASRERTYLETMDAWRTSCPRLSIWEDALADHLVVVVRASSGQGFGGSVVELTKDGRALLGRAVPAPRRGG